MLFEGRCVQRISHHRWQATRGGGFYGGFYPQTPKVGLNALFKKFRVCIIQPQLKEIKTNPIEQN